MPDWIWWPSGTELLPLRFRGW